MAVISRSNSITPITMGKWNSLLFKLNGLKYNNYSGKAYGNCYYLFQCSEGSNTASIYIDEVDELYKTQSAGIPVTISCKGYSLESGSYIENPHCKVYAF